MDILKSLLFILNEMSPYILLGFLIAGIMHSFIPRQLFARHLSGRGWKSVVKSAAIGVPLPLCSCGVLPTAIGMRRNGASKAATTSFLIATPQTGMDSIAATWSLLGPAFAVIRPIAALFTAVFGGLAVGKSEKVEKPQDIKASECVGGECEPKRSFFQKSIDALRYGFVELVGSIGPWLVVGLIIAALITVYLPADALSTLGDHPLLAMALVLIVAIPMYVCATGSIPIAMSLIFKGLSPGTALVLLMAGPAANFASFALISRELGRKSALVYLASIVIGSIAFGLAIDYLLPASWFILPMGAHAGCHGDSMTWPIFPTLCSAILVLLLVYTFIINRNHSHNHSHNTIDSIMKFSISGMNCNHCRASVEKAIAAVPGVTSANVDLAAEQALVEGTASPETIIAAVHSVGFDAALA